mgnify:CR=1 FL=1
MLIGHAIVSCEITGFLIAQLHDWLLVADYQCSMRAIMLCN